MVTSIVGSCYGIGSAQTESKWAKRWGEGGKEERDCAIVRTQTLCGPWGGVGGTPYIPHRVCVVPDGRGALSVRVLLQRQLLRLLGAPAEVRVVGNGESHETDAIGVGDSLLRRRAEKGGERRGKAT